MSTLFSRLFRSLIVLTISFALTACAGASAAQNPTAASTAAPSAIVAPTAATADVGGAQDHTVNPFDLSVSQYILDTAGFHEIATAISDTQKLDPAYLTTVTGVRKVLVQTTWPADLHDQAQAFIADLDSLAAALTAKDVVAATAASDKVHEAQHELSHALDIELGGAMHMH
ncbi:MAG: hypothetical protein WCK70_11590 [Chloroflexales bacterium]|jgi:hypothetical protein